jgi:hypothetical protein
MAYEKILNLVMRSNKLVTFCSYSKKDQESLELFYVWLVGKLDKIHQFYSL